MIGLTWGAATAAATAAADDEANYHSHYHDQATTNRARRRTASTTTTTTISDSSSSALSSSSSYFTCGSRPPSAQERQEHERAIQLYQQERLQDGSSESTTTTIVTVPVCSHIIIGRKGRNNRTDDELQAQLDHLNTAYSASSCCDVTLPWCSVGTCSLETGFRFAWAKVDATTGQVVPGETVAQITDPGACSFRLYRPLWVDQWATVDPRTNWMKHQLRRGGAETLNVYWLDFRINKLKGYATFPSSYVRKPKQDGIVLQPSTMPGGSYPGYNHGDTLVHEIGHWLGLLHTFQDGCDTSDGIIDTAPEREAYRGCNDQDEYPLNRDSCPGDDQTDPVHNYMDYSSDECKYQFTPGQILVMQASHSIYRARSTGRDRPVIELTNGVPYTIASLVSGERQVFSLAATAAVKCRTEAQEGEHTLYLKWGRPPYFRPVWDACKRTSSDTTFTASCRALHLRRDETVLYAGVESTSWTASQNLTITCTVAS